MSELAQIISKLESLERGHGEIMNAITGNDKLGQKGFVHRIRDVEKMSWENKNDLKEIKSIKAFSEKKIALIISCITVGASISIELIKTLIK